MADDVEQDGYDEYPFRFGDGPSGRAVSFKLIPPRPDTSDDSGELDVYHIEVYGDNGTHLGSIKKPTRPHDIMVIMIVEGALVIRDYMLAPED